MITPYSRSYKLENIFEAMITPVSKSDKDLVKGRIDAQMSKTVYIMSKYINFSGILGRGDHFDYTTTRPEGGLFCHFNFNDVKRIFTDSEHPQNLTVELK